MLKTEITTTDDIDNCPNTANPNQEDLNQDGIVSAEEIEIYEKSTGEKYKPSI